MNVSFRGTEAPPGVAIVDPIEQRHFHVATSSATSPRPTEESGFVFPVDATCRVETDGIRTDRLDAIYVRDAEGGLLSTVRSHQTADLDHGTYYLEICGPVKLYCRVTGTPTLTSGADYFQASFQQPIEVVLGARSYHEHPATTITTGPDPGDVMTAVSTLSSALKTTSCERAYPTLRGHPPLIEPGDELDVPAGLSSPDTGVELVVPPTLRHVYVAAPLSFYLGADLVPGEEPRLVTDRGFEYDLAGRRWFEDGVARTLKQLVFLDCLVRTEGLYRLDLHERRAVADAVDLDFAAVYDLPLAVQVEEYLETSYDVVEPHLPTWPLTAHVAARPENVEAIPFIVNDLGIVREPRGTRVRNPHEGAAGQTIHSVTDGGVAADGSNRGTGGDGLTVVEPARTDESIEHVWFGDHIPRHASKATIEAFRSRLSMAERNEVIDITVVCNDEAMLGEQQDIDDVYGNRGDLPYNVDTHFEVGTDELAAILTDSECDFLHYIGHATPAGLECPDGDLDVATLEEVSVRVFLLNACRSYEQALLLAERGAIGGVGTLGDVVNAHAIETGKAMANLLNLGFSLRAAMDLVREHTHIGEQYLIVGDGAADIAQTDGGPPSVCDVADGSDGGYDLSVTSYPTRRFRVGSTFTLTLDEVSDEFLLPGTSRTVGLDGDTLDEYLTWSSYPVRYDSSLYWNTTFGPVEFE